MINREILDRACLGVASAEEGAALRRGVLSMMDELKGLERFRRLRIRHNDEMEARTKQLLIAKERIAELEAEREGVKESHDDECTAHRETLDLWKKASERVKELEGENESLSASVDLNYDARKKVITANARIAELEAKTEELETERARVQGKLTVLCGDIWDAADRHQVDKGPGDVFKAEERATLRRVIAKIVDERSDTAESNARSLECIGKQSKRAEEWKSGAESHLATAYKLWDHGMIDHMDDCAARPDDDGEDLDDSRCDCGATALVNGDAFKAARTLESETQ